MGQIVPQEPARPVLAEKLQISSMLLTGAVNTAGIKIAVNVLYLGKVKGMPTL